MSLTATLKSLVPASPLPREKRSTGNFSFMDLFGGTTTGTTISVNNALTLPAYYNAVNQIANDIAKLPKGVYQKLDGNRKSVDHPVKYLINKEPNNLMTAFDFHFVMTLAALHRGNGVAKINRNPVTAQVDSLVFIHPNDINNIYVSKGKLYYKTKLGFFTEDEVIHIKGFSEDGLIGKSVIAYAAETLGIAKAAQNFSASNFDGRGLGFGWIKTEKQLDPGPKKTIEGAVNSKLSADGKIKTVVLDEGMEYNPITMSMQEAQLVQQGAFSIQDIARFLNISTRKLKDANSDNYASAYQDAVDHLNDCLQPWMTKYELEYGRKLFNDLEKKSIYIKINDNLMLRGDLAAKGAYYNQMVFSGIYTRNEVRGFEEMNALTGLDEPLTPVNTQTKEQIDNKIKNEQAK